MNPPDISGSKVEEHPNGLIDKVYKTLAIMRLTYMEKAQIAHYQFKDVAEVLYEQ